MVFLRTDIGQSFLSHCWTYSERRHWLVKNIVQSSGKKELQEIIDRWLQHYNWINVESFIKYCAIKQTKYYYEDMRLGIKVLNTTLFDIDLTHYQMTNFRLFPNWKTLQATI